MSDEHIHWDVAGTLVESEPWRLSDEDVERIAEAVVAKLQPPVAGVVTGPDQAVIWRPDGAWETRSKPEPT